MRFRGASLLLGISLVTLAACSPPESPERDAPNAGSAEMQKLVDKYTTVRLTADLSGLTPNQRKMVPLLIRASDLMNDLFWFQSYGNTTKLRHSIEDPAALRFVDINYGPWDRLDGDRPFLEGVGPKPLGANLYPADMTKEEFEAAAAAADDGGAALRSPYTIVTRADDGSLQPVPYHSHYEKRLPTVAKYLRQAADLAEDPGFANYLRLRADAILNDEYRASDMAWMEMKDNLIDIVIGPIENYEDKLFNYKTAYEAYVLVKDMDWSARLEKYAAMLPDLQRGLPVPEKYKRETPGRDSDLNAYDVVYYAGDCNAGAKTIAINLPNDEEVQLQKGTRRLQLKNAMRAKFDKILVPIVDVLIAEDQRSNVTFDAFFANTMFHEVAHGLGIKRTLDGSRMVREALQDQATTMEEGKADVLGLYMVTKLHERDELEGSLEDHYVTFLAGIFRSVRFGAASSHGKANMIRFNYFREQGAFSRDSDSGAYRVDVEKMRQATNALSERILRLQGDGDYDSVRSFVDANAVVGEALQADLDRLAVAGIPVDIVFEQGLEVLGL